MKKFIMLLLVAALTAAGAGCGNEKGAQTTAEKDPLEGGTAGTEGENLQEVVRGGYVEREIPLPEELRGETIFQIGAVGGKLCLYTEKERDGAAGFARYVYQGEAFAEDTPDWLADIVLEETIPPYQVIEPENGSPCLYCAGIEGEHLWGYLYRGGADGAAEEITPPDWREEVPGAGDYEYPDDITVLEDGSAAGIYYDSIRIYDGETRECLQELPLSQNLYTGKIYGGGDRFYTVPVTARGEFLGVEVYTRDASGKIAPPELFSCEEVGSCPCLTPLPDGALLCGGRGGLFTCSSRGEWECLLEGSYSSFSLETLQCMGLAVVGAGTYYALFDSEDGYMLAEYSYDADLERLPPVELTIYSLYDNTTLKHAAALYTREHPEVRVTVETGITYEELPTADVKAEIQNLHTRLLAGDKPDLLLLDGLDKEAFAEQNLLADISDIVTPMSQNGILLENVVANHTEENGAVYSVPLRISLYLSGSVLLDVSRYGDMETLAGAMEENDERLLGPMTVEKLVSVFVPFAVEDLVNNGELDEAALEDLLELLKRFAAESRMVEQFTEEVTPYDLWDYSFENGVTFFKVDGFLDAMTPLSILTDTQGSFENFESAYQPMGQLAILNGGASMEAARAFVEFALSEEAQDSDFRDGFPVNTRALENQLDKDRSEYTGYAMFSQAGGGVTEFEILPISAENGKRLLEMCGSARKEWVEDEQIEKVIREALPAYLDGRATTEQTISTIQSGLRMYLAE